ncbi:DUF2442 domain-containing protein [Methylocystis sp. 9N]|uniref:DUF2442 domain-containing protein n=1 Tax=Methylocystis borbori TaxID=3118750 RepID=A0ABU7XDX9_9HYPH
MGELTEAEIDAALRRGAQVQIIEPRADSARYDRANDRVIVELTNGCAFVFPARLAQGLEDAAPEQLEAVEILGAGAGLHWEALDVDLSVPGLLAGVFGTKSYLARCAGASRSPAKAAAARAKGGRPRKERNDKTAGKSHR